MTTRVQLDQIIRPQYVRLRGVTEDVYLQSGQAEVPLRLEIYTGWVNIGYVIGEQSWNVREEYRSFVPWENLGLVEYRSKEDIVSTAASAALSAISIRGGDPGLCGVEQAHVEFELVNFQEDRGPGLFMTLITQLGAHHAGIYSFSYHVTVLSTLTPPPTTPGTPQFQRHRALRPDLTPR
jgi:hypothetical protein